ncbi:hypothetical protein V060_02637 [Staphylococcus aureus R0294]|nr:hypothetical protein V060_02637 [Staphylococcus aureus R0294]
MNTLYKTTLLITMAVVTWKVWKISTYLKPKQRDIKIELSNHTRQTRKILDSLYRINEEYKKTD